jgi:hypothetical protein
MAIPHGRPFSAPHSADEAGYRLCVCSIAQESVISAEHLRATAADLCRQFHDLRADWDRLLAKDCLACGRVDRTNLLSRSA